MAGFWAIVYLLVAPAAVAAVQRQHTYEMDFVRNPAGHWERVRATFAQVEADPQTMRRLRKKAEDETARRQAR